MKKREIVGSCLFEVLRFNKSIQIGNRETLKRGS